MENYKMITKSEAKRELRALLEVPMEAEHKFTVDGGKDKAIKFIHEATVNYLVAFNVYASNTYLKWDFNRGTSHTIETFNLNQIKLKHTLTLNECFHWGFH